MKFCTHCGNELRDEAVICPQCGCGVAAQTASAPQVNQTKFCTYCGAEVLKEAVVCPKCGCPIKATATRTLGTGTGTGLQTTAKVFMVLSCAGFALAACLMAIFSIVMSNMTSDLELETNFGTMYLIFAVVYLIPLIWSIPMTQHYFKATRNKEPVGIAFKICSLLFVNLIAGILMLCDNNNK